MCEIDDIQVDGTVEVMDLSDGRMIRTRIENLAKIEQPVQAPSPRFSPNSPEMPEKATIFDVEEEKADEEKEEDKKDEDKNNGDKKIIINIKPE